MIPHLFTGTMYTVRLRVRTRASSPSGPAQFSTFDSFDDAYAWVEEDGFRFALAPITSTGSRTDVIAYVNLDEGEEMGETFAAIRKAISREIAARRGGGFTVTFGKPQLFLRLDSIEERVARGEEIRTEKIFNELIDL